LFEKRKTKIVGFAQVLSLVLVVSFSCDVIFLALISASCSTDCLACLEGFKSFSKVILQRKSHLISRCPCYILNSKSQLSDVLLNESDYLFIIIVCWH